MQPQRPLAVQVPQRAELQGHGVGAAVGGVLVLQGVVVVVLDGVPLRVPREGPEPVQVDLLAEPGRHGVHEEACRRPLDEDLVR